MEYKSTFRELYYCEFGEQLSSRSDAFMGRAIDAMHASPSYEEIVMLDAYGQQGDISEFRDGIEGYISSVGSCLEKVNLGLSYLYFLNCDSDEHVKPSCRLLVSCIEEYLAAHHLEKSYSKKSQVENEGDKVTRTSAAKIETPVSKKVAAKKAASSKKRKSCVVCGGTLIMRPDGNSLECQTCGVVYPLAVLQTQEAVQEDDAVVDEAELRSTMERPPIKSEKPFSSILQTDSAEKALRKITKPDRPFLESWQTSVGYSLLGAFIASIYLGTASLLGLLGFFLYCGYLIGATVYAYRIFSSLFTSSPKLNASNTASFCNLFFGGPIFGCVWNSCLTNRRMGSSNKVFIALAWVALAVWVIFCMAILIAYR